MRRRPANTGGHATHICLKLKISPDKEPTAPSSAGLPLRRQVTPELHATQVQAMTVAASDAVAAAMSDLAA